MLTNFINWIKKLFGKTVENQTDLATAERFKYDYENIKEVNFTAIFANNISNKVVSDSTVEVTDLNDKQTKRSEFINAALNKVWDKSNKITQQALGKGGKVIVPYVLNNKPQYDIIDQTRLFINKQIGEDILSATILKDTHVTTQNTYFLWADYFIENGNHIIKHKVTDTNGNIYGLESINSWAAISEEIVIANVNKLLLGFLKCPTDSRKDKDLYGVSITYGSEPIIAEIHEHLKRINREYKLTETMLGVDADLWRDEETKSTVQDQDKPFVKVNTNSLDGDAPWMLYNPEIRSSAMYGRLQELFTMLEKSVGTSKGVLTERETSQATATEIKASQYDTFTMVSAVRKNWESVLNDLAYAYDVLAEFYNLTPSGARNQFKISIDWDWTLFTSSQETFAQMQFLQTQGLIRGAKLNAWVTGQKLADAQLEIDFVKENEPTLGDLMGA